MTLIRRWSSASPQSLSSAASSLLSTIPSILTLLRRSKTVRDLEQVHARIILTGCEQDHFLITHFISFCIALCPNLSYPTSVFERVTHPNIFLWNAIVKGYSAGSSLAHSISLLNRMRKSLNVAPDGNTFPLLIRACAKALSLSEGRALHGLTLRYGIDGDLFVGSSLIDFYGKCKEIECARKVFDEMPVRSEVSWTAMIVGYLNVGSALKAKNLFDEMPWRNLASWNAMISGLAKVGDLNSARKLFDEMPERNAVSYTSMIDGYAKAGDMASARMLFEQSKDKDVIMWSALMSGYAQNGQPNEAVQIFQEMQSMNVKPDEFIMVSLMCACSQLRCLELAKWVDSYMSRSSFDLQRAQLAAALIDMNAKCGNIERATILFELMTKRDVISYCSMIQGLVIHGCVRQAVELFNRMLDEGIVPDDVAFTVILAACSRSGLVEECCHYFNSMINEYSLDPSPDQYACIVDLLGRSGKLRAAYELIRSMPIEPHAGAWGALLGACKLHGDTELGEEVARRLFELEPQNACNYVMLSDIYAAVDRWLDVSLLRINMSERGIRKIPGCSCIRI